MQLILKSLTDYLAFSKFRASFHHCFVLHTFQINICKVGTFFPEISQVLNCQMSFHYFQVTFDRQVMTRSVSLSGDVFDPSGTLTGGSRAHTSSILTKLQVRDTF